MSGTHGSMKTASRAGSIIGQGARASACRSEPAPLSAIVVTV